jgi:hypothetical protein
MEMLSTPHLHPMKSSFFFHICDVAELAIIHHTVWPNFGYKQDIKVENFNISSHFLLHARTQ